ncbi:MAG: hypothetical protein Q8R34_02395 [bacterium]|nr:hypothetical protein [bacterium]
MAKISINCFGTDQHGIGVEKEVGPKDQDIEFAFRFCMQLKERLGAIDDQMVREFETSFYKYPFGGLVMKLKIDLTEPDNGEDFDVRFEMDCFQLWDFEREALESITKKNLEKCLAVIRKSIRSRIDLPKKKQNTMTNLLKTGRKEHEKE